VQDDRVSEMRDYEEWHRRYDDPDSGLSWRLRTVQTHLRTVLDARPGPLRVLSLCSGDGRDVLEVLSARDDRERVSTTLVELHPALARAAQDRAASAGLGLVDVRTSDAARPDGYADVLPVDLLLLVGIFGNISDEDVEATIRAAPQLCSTGATVLWSRGRHREDLNDQVRAWFADAGFTELDYATLESPDRPALGVVRFDGEPQPLVPGQQLFTFLR
jgi:hypothetical protein